MSAFLMRCYDAITKKDTPVGGTGGAANALQHALDSVTGLPVAQESINGAVPVTDSIAISGNAQASIPITTTAAVSSALTSGIYDVWTTMDCYIKVATAALHTATPVTTANGYLLRAGNTVPMYIPDQEKIGGILAAGSATLYFHKVK